MADFYDISELLSKNAEYNLLLGKRANGKSYQCKKTVLDDYVKRGLKFVYLRRYSIDAKPSLVQGYFDDIVQNGYIEEITNGQWQYVSARANNIYFAKQIDGKEVKSETIGQYWDLYTAEHVKSQSFVNYGNILYEEFVTDGLYLTDEPHKLMQFISTVARLNRIRVLLVGNTLTKVCPYFTAWHLDRVLKQKIGTIDVYEFPVGDDSITLAVEYCRKTKSKNYMFFGDSAKQIVSGEWDNHAVPVLPKPREMYDIIYTVQLEYENFSFVMELLVDPVEGGRIIFVYPYNHKRNIVRKITTVFSDQPYITSVLNAKNRAEAAMIDCFRMKKVCYSDNITGTDFENVMKNFRFF